MPSIDTVTIAYAICIVSLPVGLTVINLLARTSGLRRRLAYQAEKQLVYRLLVHRHSLFGPWNAISLLRPAILISINVFCLTFHQPPLLARSGLLTLFNLLPLFIGPYLEFVADVLGLSFSTFVSWHRWQGRMTCAMLIVHALSAVADQKPVSLDSTKGIFIYIVGSLSVLASAYCFIPFLRRRIYEICLRLHQALAALVVVGVWLHLLTMPNWPWLWIYVFLLVIALLLLVQVCLTTYRNKKLGRTLSRAYIRHVTGTILISVKLSRPVSVEAGQYVTLWIPRVGLLQTHPFVVSSWTESPQEILELFIKRRRGLTSSLLRYSEERPTPHVALVSGPHGVSVPVWDYEAVFMVATDYGIAAQAPYLRKLVHGYNNCKGRTRQIHLIWQVSSLGIVHAAESFLNPILDDDTLDQGNILDISIYYDMQQGGMTIEDLEAVAPVCLGDASLAEKPMMYTMAAPTVEKLLAKYYSAAAEGSQAMERPTRVKNFGDRARLFIGSPDLSESLYKASRMLSDTVSESSTREGDMLLLGRQKDFLPRSLYTNLYSSFRFRQC
ncbi:FAD-binding domain-containing protein [Colletotrichum truncatum]|uniref:FAD-binding domain-containing protein n=1 Tax=Colletotrichum truncatum TaxID=5467 RepID=A0ACC3YCL9_COLTU|nr:FAD-binding domain-containing protein [Colletotrichum truncatum]KAF6793995.1 FAD-binding domain-containing protein [Colletotrichum truncatum]